VILNLFGAKAFSAEVFGDRDGTTMFERKPSCLPAFRGIMMTIRVYMILPEGSLLLSSGSDARPGFSPGLVAKTINIFCCVEAFWFPTSHQVSQIQTKYLDGIRFS